MSDLANPVILVVDDEPDILSMLHDHFMDQYEVLAAASGRKAIELTVQDKRIAAVVMDIKMPDMDGLTAMEEIHKIDPYLPVILLTGFPGDFQQEEIDARYKPFEYIVKLEDPSVRLDRAVRNGVTQYRLREDSIPLDEFAETRFDMIGSTPEMMEVYRRMRQYASFNNEIVIIGETGTGKELVAKGIHSISKRKDKPLVVYNCNLHSRELVGSEFFGHVRGAFTGSLDNRQGLFESADGGTIFLDEIGDLNEDAQGIILRVLESGEYHKLGSDKVCHTDIRLLSATNHNLEELMEKGIIRKDFYYRIMGTRIILPPLRHRRADIPLLAEKYKNKYTCKIGLPDKVFERGAMDLFIQYDWPGNVRQLKKAIESLIPRAENGIITAHEVSVYLNSNKPPLADDPVGLAEQLQQIERMLIENALDKCYGNISATARYLKMDRANLSKKIKKYRFELSRFDIPQYDL